MNDIRKTIAHKLLDSGMTYKTVSAYFILAESAHEYEEDLGAVSGVVGTHAMMEILKANRAEVRRVLSPLAEAGILSYDMNINTIHFGMMTNF